MQNTKRPPMSKKASQRRHFVRKARERYGLVLRIKRNVKAIEKMIMKGGASVLFVKNETNRVAHFIIRYNNITFPALFDRRRKCMITALPNAYTEELIKKEIKEGVIRDE